MSTVQINLTARTKLDSINPDTLYPNTASIGQIYVGGGKTFNMRSVFRVDVATPLSGWTTLTAARLVGDVLVSGSAFAATLRQVTEEFTYTQASYNHRTTADHWTNAGAETPDSATDTNKIAFTSPASVGLQTIVSGLLTLVNLALGADGILRFHIRSDNESPGVTTTFTENAVWYLEVDGTAPPETVTASTPGDGVGPMGMSMGVF